MQTKNTPIEQKEIQRRAILAHRDEMSAELRAKFSRSVVEYAHLLSPKPYEQIIAAFLPIRSEIDARPLISHLRAEGAAIALPAMVGEKNNKHIVFRAFEEESTLVTMDFGTLGPSVTAPVVDPHLILLPLAAYDRVGNRIGYGGGHYDRSIAAMRVRGLKPHLVGLCFSCQEIEKVAAEPHDVRLDSILTEKGIVVF